jgi:hypothetical protein
MNVTCRCGQVFTLYGEQFPRCIRCPLCARRFGVLDSGELVELTESSAVPLSYAFQTDAVHKSVLKATASVCADDRMDALKAARDEVMSPDANPDLALIDLLWQTERDTYSLIPFFGIELMPSKTLAFAVGVLCVVAWSTLMGVGLHLHYFGWLCPGTLAAFVTTFLPVYMYRRAHEYERAVVAWQRKRVLAIAKADRKWADS